MLRRSGDDGETGLVLKDPGHLAISPAQSESGLRRTGRLRTKEHSIRMRLRLVAGEMPQMPRVSRHDGVFLACLSPPPQI